MTTRKQITIGELERNGAIIAIQDGNHGEKHPVAADYVTTGIPFLMASDVKDGTVDLVNCKFITKAQADSLRIGFARSGDVLLTHKGTVGNVAVLPQIDGYVMLTPQVTYYRLNDEILSNRYLRYAFAEPSFQARLTARSAQSTRPYIGITAQRDLEIAWVERQVQEQIACILSAYDDLIENNTRRIRVLEQMGQMLHREWFVNFRFPGYEKVKVVESKRGRVPEGWKAGILRDVCKSIDYGYTASADKEAVGPKFLRITDIVPESIDWESVPFCAPPEKRIENYLLGEGDIVVARTGATTGYAKRLNKRHPVSIFASYLVRLKIGEEHSNAAFGLLVESDDYKRFITANIGGAAQPQANAQVLTSIPVVIPPQKIQSDFSSIVEPLLDEKEILQLKNLNLRRTRDLLLPKLISGEISIDGVQIESAAQTV
jgi:type I restriction enzyme S subunit